MKRLIVFLFVLFSFQGFSQEEVEWFQPGQEWYYNVYCLQNFGCGYTYYEVSGNEVIGGQEAQELTRIYLDEGPDESLVSSEYLRFENDTVWRYSTVAEQWHMLWDIGAEVGDVWTIQEDVHFGYGEDEFNPENIPLFKVVVDSVAFWEEVPDSPLTDRRVIYVRPVINEVEESLYTFGPILEGVGPVGGAHYLIGNSSGVLLPLQTPYFQCFLDDGELVYGSGTSPCYVLSTSEVKQIDHGLIYPNPSSSTIFWDEPIDALRIFNAQGKLVIQKSQMSNESSLSLVGLQPGFYSVVIEHDKMTFSQKLMVTR